MRILMLNVYLNRGSTGRIADSLSAHLRSRGHTVVHCYRDGIPAPDGSGCRIGRRIETALTYRLNYLLGVPYGGAYLSTLRLLRTIRREKIDVVCMHSVNGSYVNIYWLLRKLKQWDIPVVMTHHSEYLYTGNCTHAMDCDQWMRGCCRCERHREYHLSLLRDSSARAYGRMLRAFRGLRRCRGIAVSEWVLNRAKQSAIMQGIPHEVIENGIDERIFFPRDAGAIRAELGLKGQKAVLFCTACFSDRESDIKGGRHIIALARRLERDNVRVLVAALTVQTRREYENIQMLGPVGDPDRLAELYSAADAVVIASRRETFSMPLAEAMMCGTPVAGFFAGGPETIAIPEYSRFCEYGNVDALHANVLELIAAKHDRNEISRRARERYSRDVMCRKYSEVIESMLAEKGEGLP